MGLGEASIPTTPPEVAIGIPADLIRRRPDVRRAEREVAANLRGSGLRSPTSIRTSRSTARSAWPAVQFGDLFDGNRGTVAGVGPAFRWDILNYGRILNRVRVEDAKFQAAAYAYQEKALQAAREAEDGIVLLLKSHRRANRWRQRRMPRRKPETSRWNSTDRAPSSTLRCILPIPGCPRCRTSRLRLEATIAKSDRTVPGLGRRLEMRFLPQSDTAAVIPDADLDSDAAGVRATVVRGGGTEPGGKPAKRGHAMIRSRLSIVCVCLSLLGSSMTRGADPAACGSKSGCPPCIITCPDDYCRKPLPCIPCPPCRATCDDYCRKPMPRVPCLTRCGTCDDYCRKPFPRLCWPPLPALAVRAVVRSVWQPA